MAGLLDYIGRNGGSLGGFIQQLDDMTKQFVPPNMAPQNVQPLVDLPALLGRIDRATSSPTMGQFVTGLPQPDMTQPGLSQQDFNDRFGAMQPPAQQPQAALAPQMQPAAQAQQAFAMPDSTYAFGGQMVPAFGQAQPPVTEMSAAGRKAPVAVPNDPTTAQPTFSSELFGAPKSDSFNSRLNDFIGVLNPEIGARNDAKKAQSETARGLYEIYRGQGMSPNEAASRAVIEARNPKIMEERMKPYANMEQRLANQPNGPQGNATQQYYDYLAGKTKTEELAKKRADAESNRETLRLELPAFDAEAKKHIADVEALVNHPGRKGNVWWHGKGSSFLPDGSIPGNTAAGDALNRLNQIKGGAFLEAFKALKGGGQVTEIEGKKATDAKNRMNRATSEAEFNAAASDYIGAIKSGLDKLHAQAASTPPNGYRGNDGWNLVPMPGSNTPVRIRQVQ